jgi:hypothetical protein
VADPVASITAWGLPRAADIVELAAAERLNLAAACTMLEKESGGRNVWGSDGVDTGGYYTKGAAVTRADYERWKPHRARLGSQGVGPTQLTYPPLQDQADQAGGCWDWRVNVRVGFRHLAQLQRQYGTRGGFRRYNGAGPMAEKYADDAMAKLARWTDRLDVPTPQPGPRPLEDDMPLSDDDLARIRDAVWQGPIDDLVYGGTAQAWQHLQRANASAARADQELDALTAKMGELIELLRGIAPAIGVDAQALAAAVAGELAARLATP